jgi:hypothetical protein
MTHEFRLGVQEYLWLPDRGYETYLTPGYRTGFALGELGFELGLPAVMPIVPSMIAAAPELGFTMNRVPITVRGTLPVLIAGWNGSQLGINAGIWPQATILVGPKYRPRGFGLALGVRGSLLAMGPLLVAEYNFGRVAVRPEVSLMFRPLWAGSDSTIKGQTLTAGLTVAGTLPKRQALR